MLYPEMKSVPRYRQEKVLTLRDGAYLLLLCAVVYFAAEFCLSRLLFTDWIRTLASGVVSLGALLLPAAFVLSAKGASWRTVMGQGLGAGKGFWIILSALFGLIVTMGLQLLWMIALEKLGWSRFAAQGTLPQSPLILQILVMGLGAAVCEEITLRGILLPAMERSLGRGAAIGLTALFFSLLHGDIAKIPVTFLCGLFLALLTVRAGTIKASILYHFTHNTASLIIAHFAGGTQEGAAGSFSQLLSEPGMTLYLSLAAALVVLLGGILVLVFYKAFARRCGKATPPLARDAGALHVTTGLIFLAALCFAGLRILANALGVFA